MSLRIIALSLQSPHWLAGTCAQPVILAKLRQGLRLSALKQIVPILDAFLMSYFSSIVIAKHNALKTKADKL
jgi:hypothetical protein